MNNQDLFKVSGKSSMVRLYLESGMGLRFFFIFKGIIQYYLKCFVKIVDRNLPYNSTPQIDISLHGSYTMFSNKLAAG